MTKVMVVKVILSIVAVVALMLKLGSSWWQSLPSLELQASEKQIKNAIHYGECEEGGGMSIEKHGIYDAGKLDDLSTDDIPIHFTNQVRCILVQ